jgi:phage repressor protein C with HTH and peptisase S24 domain
MFYAKKIQDESGNSTSRIEIMNQNKEYASNEIFKRMDDVSK